MAKHIEKCEKGKTSSRENNIFNYCKVKVPQTSKKEVLNSVTNLVVKDLRPFSVLEGEGMKDFAKKMISIGAKYGCVDTEDLLPSRNTICKHVKGLASQ